MPNYVTNLLSCDNPEVFKAIQGKSQDDDPVLIDFNSIVPMPEIMSDASMQCPDLETTAISLMHCGEYKCEPSRDEAIIANCVSMRVPVPPIKMSNTRFNILLQYMHAYKEFGTCSWYSWSCKYWGTKWNACHIEQRDDGLAFQTAWSMPVPWIVALSKEFPDDAIRIQWADEDLGYNLGDEIYKHGKRVSKRVIPEATHNAHIHALKIIYNNEMPSDMQWNRETGFLEYIGEDE